MISHGANGTNGVDTTNAMHATNERSEGAPANVGRRASPSGAPHDASKTAGVDDREARRAELRRQSDCQFLDADSFRRMLVSARRLRRRDDGVAKLKGLLDIATGTWFVIEEENVFQTGVS